MFSIIVDCVEDNFLNIWVDDLLHECFNFTRTNISSIIIKGRASICNYIHVKRWCLTLITHPCHNPDGKAGARLWNGVSHPCLLFNGFLRTRVLIIYHIQCIYAEVFECRRFGLSMFRFVDVSGCRCFDQWSPQVLRSNLNIAWIFNNFIYQCNLQQLFIFI